MAESLDLYTQMILADAPMRSIQRASTSLGDNIKLYTTNKSGQEALSKVDIARVKQQEDMRLQKLQEATDITKTQAQIAKQILANNEATRQFYNSNIPVLQKQAEDIANIIY